MTLNPLQACVPAAERPLLATMQDKMLCLAGVASLALQQTLPSAGASLYSLPAAAYLTANLARQALIARTPTVQNSSFLKHILSPWTLLASYALRGWQGWDAPEKIVAGASALTLLHHASQSLQGEIPAAVEGNPLAIAACTTHLANAILSAVGATAAWTTHSFLNFHPEVLPNYVQEGVETALDNLDHTTHLYLSDANHCSKFLNSLYYLNKVEDVWVTDNKFISRLPKDPEGIFQYQYKELNNRRTGESQLRLESSEYEILKALCHKKHLDYMGWIRSPEYFYRRNIAVLWREFGKRIYDKKLPGAEAAEVWRHMSSEFQPRMQDFFSPSEMKYLEEINEIESVIEGENFRPDWIEQNGFEKYVSRMVRWWENEWYPAWNGMAQLWQKADLPRKEEFDAWLLKARKGNALIYRVTGRFNPSSMLLKAPTQDEKSAASDQFRNAPAPEMTAYQYYRSVHGALTPDELYQKKEALYREWLAFRNRIEKEVSIDKIRQFEGNEKSRTALSPCSNKICSLTESAINRNWGYVDHTKGIYQTGEEFAYFSANGLYHNWKKAYDQWIAIDKFLAQTPEDLAKIDEAERKDREEGNKRYDKAIADELHGWTTVPLKEIMADLTTPQEIVDRYRSIHEENRNKVWDHLSEEERNIILDASRAVRREELRRKYPDLEWLE